jgi:hypothetical protein
MDESDARRIETRCALSIALEDSSCPAERRGRVDSGNFMGYPSMYLSVPDERASASPRRSSRSGSAGHRDRAALARPDRLPVAALGDGGALMGVSELETVGAAGLPMVVVVYDDEATAPRCTTSVRTATRSMTCGSRRPTSPRSAAGSGSRA